MIIESTNVENMHQSPAFAKPMLGAVPLSEVYLEDCVKALKRFNDNHFDLAIVDPPYKEETTGLSAGFNRSHFNYGTLNTPPTEEYINELFRVSKNQIMWGFNYYLKLLPNTDALRYNKVRFW